MKAVFNLLCIFYILAMVRRRQDRVNTPLTCMSHVVRLVNALLRGVRVVLVGMFWMTKSALLSRRTFRQCGASSFIHFPMPAWFISKFIVMNRSG